MNLSERWLYKIIIVGLLVAFFLYVGNRQLDDVYEDIAEYKAELMADRFAKSVSHIHQQWSAEGKPKYLELDYFYDIERDTLELSNLGEQPAVKIWLKMSRRGWPLAVGKNKMALNCKQLWRYFAETRTNQKEMVQIDIKQQNTVCVFSWPTTEKRIKTFSYDSQIGEFISKTTNREIIADKAN